MRWAVAVLLAMGATVAGAASVAAEDAVGFADPATGRWYLPEGRVFYFGDPGDTPFAGDWDCDGVVTPGLHRPRDGFVYLRSSNSQGIATTRYYFGNPGDVAVVGDWNGDGCDTVSLWRPDEGKAYIIDRLGSDDAGLGAADHSFSAGGPGERPFAFDHDGDGTDSLAFHDPATGEVTIAGVTSYYGNPGDVMLGGTDLIAYRPDTRTVFTADGSCLAGQRSWLPVLAPSTGSTGTTAVSVAPDERRALAPGVGIEVSWPGGRAVLNDCSPNALVDATMGTALEMTYLSPDGEAAAPSWTQHVTAPTVSVRQPWRETGAAEGDIVLAWQSTGDSGRYLAEIDAAPGLTVTSPIRWRLNSDGSIAGTPDAAFISNVRARGIEVWPAIASLDAERIALAMADPLGLAARISAEAEAAGADGVNIDFEGYHHAQSDAVATFATELTRLVHEWGGVTSLDITPRTDAWDITSVEFDALHWSQAPLRRELADGVDYLILMAYDEHNRHRPAGPVASPHWVEDVTRYLLRYTDSHRLILGVPFYGRLWGPELFDRPRARGIGSLTASESKGSRRYDARFGLDRVDFADGTYLWSETPHGLAHRVALKDELGLAGLAAWRLGFDSAEIWPVVAP